MCENGENTVNEALDEEDRFLAIQAVEDALSGDDMQIYDYASAFFEAAVDYRISTGRHAPLKDFRVGYRVIATWVRNDIEDCDERYSKTSLTEDETTRVRRATQALQEAERKGVIDNNNEWWPHAEPWIKENLPGAEFEHHWTCELVDSFTFNDPVHTTLWRIWAAGQK